MNSPRPHKIRSASTIYNYVSFDSVLSFNSFVDYQVKKLSDGNNIAYENLKYETRELIESGTDWFGTPAPSGLLDLEEHKKYLGMSLVGQVQNEIKNYLHKYMEYLNSEVLPKRKASFNDKGLGIFCFDRTSTTLFKQNQINLRTPIDKVITKLGIELGSSKLQTKTKNVYAFFEHKNKYYPSMRLYLLAGANAYIKGNEMLYVGLACGELVEFMEQRNVPVEVNVLIGSNFKGQTAIAVVRVKAFEERLDKNQVLLISSDPRYFRYKGFNALIALANYNDLTIPDHLGSIKKEMAKDFVKALGNNGFVFEQSYSLDQVCKEVVANIENYKTQLKNEKRD